MSLLPKLPLPQPIVARPMVSGLRVRTRLKAGDVCLNCW